jgi:WD40 repeat protein
MNFHFKLTVLILSVTLIKINQAQNLTLKNHTHFIRAISFTNDYKVITISDDLTMKAWDPLKNWTLISNYFQTLPTFCCLYSTNGVNKNDLFAASVGAIAYVWNLTDSSKLIKKFNEHNGTITNLAMTTSSNILATGSTDSTIRIWGMNSNNSLFNLTEHSLTVWGLAFLNNSVLVSSSQDKLIKLWNITNGTCLKTLTGHTGTVYTLLILTDELFASGSADKTIKIWNETNSSCLATFTGHIAPVRSMAKITDSIIASNGEETSIMVWNLTDYKRIAKFIPNEFYYRSISYSSNPKFFINE